jgi:metal-responsive CopG/Arc/MetJ family transcriptional regulator
MDPVLPVRAPKELITRVESWAQKQPDKPSRSEAVRRLLELALNLKDKG